LALADLFSLVSETVVASRDEWIIDKMALIFVEGVENPAPIDQLRLIRDILAQLMEAHIRFLRIISQPGVFYSQQIPVDPSGRTRQFMKYRSDSVWPWTFIVASDPGLADARETLVGRLVMLGIVREFQVDDHEGFCYELTAFGRACAADMRERASGGSRSLAGSR
jgi:hypothetical protein